eukprot:gene8897-biopygen18168
MTEQPTASPTAGSASPTTATVVPSLVPSTSGASSPPSTSPSYATGPPSSAVPTETTDVPTGATDVPTPSPTAGSGTLVLNASLYRQTLGGGGAGRDPAPQGWGNEGNAAPQVLPGTKCTRLRIQCPSVLISWVWLGSELLGELCHASQLGQDDTKPTQPSCNPAPSYAPHAHVARWKLPNNGAGGAREKMETGAKGAGGMGKKWRRRFAAAPGLFGTRVMNDPCHQKDMPRHSEAEPTKPNSSKLCPAHKFSQAVSNRISARFRAPDYACAHLHKIMTCTGVRPHSISDKCPTSGRPFRTIHPERVPPMCKGAGPLSSDRRQRWCGAARARRSPAPARRKAPNCAWCIPFVAPATTFNPGED